METRKQTIIRWILILLSAAAFFYGVRGMNEQIRKEMHVPDDHVPCPIDEFPCCNFPDWCEDVHQLWRATTEE